MNVNDPDPYRTPTEVSTAKRGLLKSPLAWVLAAAVVAAVAVGIAGSRTHVVDFGENRAGPPIEDYMIDQYEAEMSAEASP